MSDNRGVRGFHIRGIMISSRFLRAGFVQKLRNTKMHEGLQEFAYNQDPPSTLNWGYMAPNSVYSGPTNGAVGCSRDMAVKNWRAPVLY